MIRKGNHERRSFRSRIFSSIARIAAMNAPSSLPVGSSRPHLAAAGIVNADKGNFLHHSFSLAFSLQIIWVMVPMGQKVHQVRGLNRAITARPMMVEVSIRL